MQKVCKKCDGSGKVLKQITYGGGTYGDKGYWYRVWEVDKCEYCLKIKFMKILKNPTLTKHLLSVFAAIIFGCIMIYAIAYFIFK